jgi:predicted phage-related endonuclease
MGSLTDTLTSAGSSWPRIEDLGLSQKSIQQRRGAIGGSDANIILSGNQERIQTLWAEKTGLAVPADLSGNLPIALGSWSEPFNRQWYEKLSGKSVVRSGESIGCPRYPWRRCTLDGVVEETEAVWEAKHTSAFAKPDEVLERYMPQLQHNMVVAGLRRAELSVIFGNHKFEVFVVEADWLYQIELLRAEDEFWKSVLSKTPPVAAEVPPAPRPVGVREICLEGNNAWASSAADWLQFRDAAKAHASACSSIKELVEPDVARAFGHGVEAKRSKSGAISIRELIK